MLKGVSQNVIEVIDLENRYFEKAILFLRPAQRCVSHELLDHHAQDYLKDIRYTPARPGRLKAVFDRALTALIPFSAGALVSAACFMLFLR